MNLQQKSKNNHFDLRSQYLPPICDMLGGGQYNQLSSKFRTELRGTAAQHGVLSCEDKDCTRGTSLVHVCGLGLSGWSSHTGKCY